MLEQRITQFEFIWSTVFPDVSLTDLEALAHEIGTELAISSLNLRPSTPSRLAQRSDAINAIQSPRDPPRPDLTSAIYVEDPLPPTRLGSPSTLPLKSAYDYQDHVSPGSDSYSWHEGGPEPANLLDGMGGDSRPLHKGSSFLGLSSSATFLSAIERLSNPNKTPLEPNRDLSSWNLADGFSSPYDSLSSHISPRGETKVAREGTKFRMLQWSEVGPLVESYFRYFHRLTPIVHEPTARAQMLGALSMSPGAGPSVLFNMIFAMGELEKAEKESDPIGSKYYLQARLALQQSFLEEGSVELVQGLAIMAIYLQHTNRPNAGYLCLGSAIRMAIALGLHLPAKTLQKSTSLLRSEIRLRVWCCLVTLEAGCSITFGRPHGVGTTMISSRQMPVNCDDERLTVSTTERPDDKDEPTVYSALIVQAHLANVTSQIYSRILHSEKAPTIEQIQWCDRLIMNTMAEVPANIKTPRVGPNQLALFVQEWRIRDQRVILYRPVLLAAAWASWHYSFTDPAVASCVQLSRELAMANMHSTGECLRTAQLPVQRETEWYALYFGYQAALTVLLSLVWEPMHTEAVSWKAALMKATSWFRELSAMRQLGQTYASRIEQLVSRAIVQSYPNKSPIATQPANWADLFDTFQVNFDHDTALRVQSALRD
ncbi:fungal-specific transcription factor domain-domain-containing protein [Kockovaella imperatae]|uniref:Fungal-specific transcription factor domain-domain-containing protein n=1 Tax=Kockovaella imperatae TaxID=4999 RepID=A0A1Y1UDF1_9TREE|nr:fungal-specific transcription factor domain-domain-containing protein [Kockovaella imperatae]ORX35105.1 fungal-specific transcription factor domain-domain-containing protein [Kockovaella imperatae]